MANEGITDPSRFDNNQAGSGFNDLFLKQFTGEILTTFDEKNVFRELHTTRTISSGRSATFPVTGIASAVYHQPGKNIIQEGGASSTYLSDITKTEKIITIDDLLISSTMLYNLDDMKNHYDIRSIYARELAKALAVRYDTAVCKVMIAAARASANLTQTNKTGGQVDIPNGDISAPGTTGTKAAYDAQDLINAFFVAAEQLDNNDVDEDGRFAVLAPTDYYTLITGANTDSSINFLSAVNSDIGGSGSISTGKVMQIAGISIYKSTHIPTTNMDTGTSGTATDDSNSNNDVFGSGGNGYDGDFRNTVGLIGHTSAVGTVQLMDLATESEYKPEYQGTLFLAKYALGHGILRPEAMLELVA
jgi:hypothetical protein